MNRSKSPAPRRGTEPDAEQDGEGWLLWLLSILLVILVVAVFGQTARFGFINFDDDQYVTGSALTQLGLSAEGVRSAWTSSQVGNWHPLTTWSFMLDWQLFGMKASGYHLHNVLLHAGATVLLFLALCRMTRALWLSALVAVIFAIHPLRAESVAWVSERKDVLSGFYFMLTLWAYAVYVSQPSMLRYLAVLVFFVLGLMCKAMLVTLPVVLLLLDYWPLRRFETGEEAHAEQPGGALETPRVVIQRMLGLVREKWLLFVLAGVFSVVTARLSLDADRSEKVLDLSVRLAMAPVTYVTYLGKMLYPVHLVGALPLRGDRPAWVAGAGGRRTAGGHFSGCLVAAFQLSLDSGRLVVVSHHGVADHWSDPRRESARGGSLHLPHPDRLVGRSRLGGRKPLRRLVKVCKVSRPGRSDGSDSPAVLAVLAPDIFLAGQRDAVAACTGSDI